MFAVGAADRALAANPGEATAAMAATTAATRNNEQRTRRHGDGLNVRCGYVVIELLSFIGLL